MSHRRANRRDRGLRSNSSSTIGGHAATPRRKLISLVSSMRETRIELLSSIAQMKAMGADENVPINKNAVALS